MSKRAPATPQKGHPSVEMMPLASLKPHPNNPRQHPDRSIDAVKRSIEAFGFTNPVLVSADGYVLAGHTRIKAAERAGLREVPVIRLSLSGPDADAYLIADNQTATLSEWDMPKLADLLSELDGNGFDATLTGFDTDELEKILGHVPAIEFGGLPDGEKSPFEQMTFTLTADQADTLREAMEAAKNSGPFVDTGNENSNGNALARVAEFALGAFRA